MSENWRPVVGYEGRYEVSDQGRVRSVATGRIKTTRVRDVRGGYEELTLHRDGAQAVRYVHRLVLDAFVGPRPEGLVSRHLNGNPVDNRLANLRYGTQSQNILDAVQHGTHRWARVTHCPHGHEYTEANTRLDQGKRRCLACLSIRWKARRRVAT